MKRTFFLAAVAALSAASQAITLSLVSVGTFDDSNPALLTQDEAVVVSHIGTLPALSTLHAESTFSPFTTTAVYTSTSGTLTFDLVYDNTEVGGFGISTDSGLWTVLGGTGSYAGYAGSGSYSINYNAPDNNFSQTTLIGDIEAVPEPASIAVLSLGALGLLRRRKKA